MDSPRPVPSGFVVKKGSKSLAADMARDPGAAVGHRDRCLAVARGGPHAQGAPLRHRLDCIHQDVDQGLAHARRVARQPGNAFAQVPRQRNALEAKLPARHVEHLAHHLVQVARPDLQRAAAREVPQVLDDALAAQRVVAHPLQVAMDLRPVTHVLHQQVDVHEDAGERVVELVRDPRGEHADRCELLRPDERIARLLELRGARLHQAFEARAMLADLAGHRVEGARQLADLACLAHRHAMPEIPLPEVARARDELLDRTRQLARHEIRDEQREPRYARHGGQDQLPGALIHVLRRFLQPRHPREENSGHALQLPVDRVACFADLPEQAHPARGSGALVEYLVCALADAAEARHQASGHFCRTGGCAVASAVAAAAQLAVQLDHAGLEQGALFRPAVGHELAERHERPADAGLEGANGRQRAADLLQVPVGRRQLPQRVQADGGHDGHRRNGEREETEDQPGLE